MGTASQVKRGQAGRGRRRDGVPGSHPRVFEVMSEAEARQRFRDEWIVLAVERYTPDLRVARGVLVVHTPDKQAAYAAASRYRAEHPGAGLAIFYHGAIQAPPGVEVVL